ncbi:acyl-CoA dehydrogenase NM domain-like protein [Aspergillus homomorphus CBS 101889]|uniref:Acyl-CoA dehydrogenase NM domain-like protein n=1 Tax=Aspergillus homomorphus (strain CBS 101889) TaxID=1450537 RepID=A0A395I4W1_ASPHC|nr:acyl-CoA dehydrogenase NM domain-like protein [Aspergillus homomorphus CBS 101889]RAL14815.1 acyl-CoA dehydrogenase NM domain-like protein [Aspergillus homomorphus CBS 101889]
MESEYRALYHEVWHTPSPTLELAQSALMKPAPLSMTLEERTRLTYQRARALAHAYSLTLEDVLNTTPKFWKLHIDMLTAMDGGAINLVSVAYNLFVGTVAPYVASQPELAPIVQQAMNFDISAQFMLTELGHGLDARNLETTATLMPDNSFILNTPSPAAAKCMPPNTPRHGLPTFAVVIARLIVKGEDRGVRPFLVQMSDGVKMYPGITAKVFPPRPGANPIDHALTYFDRVQLPFSALLGGKQGRLEKSNNERDNFLATIHRMPAGTLFLAGGCIPLIKMAVYNSSKFSFRRHILGHDGQPMPVIDFRTQHLPILHAIARAHVLQAFLIHAGMSFCDRNITDPRVRHAFATIFKAVTTHHFQTSLESVNKGCGWHGYYDRNQILQADLEFRAVATAEGDVRVLAIRLASELLIGRYQVPPPKNPNGALAQHEAGLFAEARVAMKLFGSRHRSEAFNRTILPLALPLVQAIGYRMAIEAAIEAGIDPKLRALYQVGIIKEASAWFAEYGLSRQKQREMEAEAADAVLPDLERLVEETGVEPYCTAPMTSDRLWNDYVGEFETFSGGPAEASQELKARL